MWWKLIVLVLSIVVIIINIIIINIIKQFNDVNVLQSPIFIRSFQNILNTLWWIIQLKSKISYFAFPK